MHLNELYVWKCTVKNVSSPILSETYLNIILQGTAYAIKRQFTLLKGQFHAIEGQYKLPALTNGKQRPAAEQNRENINRTEEINLQNTS